VKSTAFPVHAIQEVAIQRHSVLTSTLDARDLSASCSSHFTSGERSLGTHWVCFRAGAKTVENIHRLLLQILQPSHSTDWATPTYKDLNTNTWKATIGGEKNNWKWFQRRYGQIWVLYNIIIIIIIIISFMQGIYTFFRRQSMFLGNTVLRPFCCSYSWCIHR
jgi:hypothetical protein